MPTEADGGSDAEEAEQGTAYIVAWSLAVVVATVAVAFVLHGTAEAAWRTAGGLLEACGLVRGAVAVEEKVSRVRGVPRLMERVRRWLAALWRRVRAALGLGPEPEHIVLEVDPIKMKMSMGDARLSARPADDAELRRWIEYLDGELQALQTRLEKVQRKHRERLDVIHEELTETRRELREADREVEDLVERLAVGGFRWELVALGWFLAGVVASSWARYLPDLAASSLWRWLPV